MKDFRSLLIALLFWASSSIKLYAQSAPAQTAAAPAVTVPLTVERGVPLHVVLTHKLGFKPNEPVHGRLVDAVYAWDRTVLPAALEIDGHVVRLIPAPRRARVAALLGGDFTPLSTPEIQFDTLILPDGRHLPLETKVTPGTGKMIRSGNPQKRGRIASAKESLHQQIDARKRALLEAVQPPGRWRRLADALIVKLPYHPQWLPIGTRFNAQLLAPLQFGAATIPAGDLRQLGAEPSSDSMVYARLVSGLDSRTARKGAPVQALLSRPLFSPDHHLLYPVGSRLSGTVLQAKAARSWHRTGQLRFTFQQIEPPAVPPAAAQSAGTAATVWRVEGLLESAEVDSKQQLQMDQEGGAKAVASKKRFIAPAISLMLANAGMDHDVIRSNGISTGQYSSNTLGRALAGGVGFGLIGVGLAQISRPVAGGLGFYGAAISIYSNVIARGQEVSFPADTPIEVRFGSRPESQETKLPKPPKK